MIDEKKKKISENLKLLIVRPKMMKQIKIIPILLAILFLFSGCKSGSDKDSSSGKIATEILTYYHAARQGEAKPRSSSPQKGCLSAPLRDCA